jgi:hypothetical protein
MPFETQSFGPSDSQVNAPNEERSLPSRRMNALLGFFHERDSLKD